MTNPMNTIEGEVAKALVQAAVAGLTTLVKKVPALFRRQGKAKEEHADREVERTVARLRAVTGTEVEREQGRQEAAWEVLLRGLIEEYPDAAKELNTLAAEIHAALPDAPPVGAVVGPVNIVGDSNIVGKDITITHHHPDRGDSQLELSAITLTTTGPRHDSSAVLDLKLRNTGGQPALLHRATFRVHDAVSLSPYSMVGFLPYEAFWVRGALHVSQTYDISLPDPTEIDGTPYNLDLSQAIEPAGTDRFHIRLGIPKTQDTLVYLLHLDIHYDARRALTSPTIAIAHPPGRGLVSPDEIRSDLHDFRKAVHKVRRAIDREIVARGLPAPDWGNHPPANRADLPANLRSVDGDPASLPGLGGYEVNDAFWNPENSLAQRLRDIHAYCTHVVNIITGAEIRHDTLARILVQAQIVLTQLPAIAAEFGVELGVAIATGAESATGYVLTATDVDGERLGQLITSAAPNHAEVIELGDLYQANYVTANRHDTITLYGRDAAGDWWLIAAGIDDDTAVEMRLWFDLTHHYPGRPIAAIDDNHQASHPLARALTHQRDEGRRMDATRAISLVVERINSRGLDQSAQGLVADRFDVGWSVYAPVDIGANDPTASVAMLAGRSSFLVSDFGRIKAVSAAIPSQQARELFTAEETFVHRGLAGEQHMAEVKDKVMRQLNSQGPLIRSFTIISPEEVIAANASELAAAIVQQLAPLGPPGWERFAAVFSFTVSAEVGQLQFWSGNRSGTVSMPEQIAVLVRRQRHIAARMPAGPWWRLLLTVTNHGEMTLNYDYGDEPFPSDQLLAPEHYRNDLATYTRAHIPAWLAGYLTQADATGQAANPPQPAPGGGG